MHSSAAGGDDPLHNDDNTQGPKRTSLQSARRRKQGFAANKVRRDLRNLERKMNEVDILLQQLQSGSQQFSDQMREVAVMVGRQESMREESSLLSRELEAYPDPDIVVRTSYLCR